MAAYGLGVQGFRDFLSILGLYRDNGKEHGNSSYTNGVI